MRNLALVVLVAVVAGCGAQHHEALPHVRAAKVQRCSSRVVPLGTSTRAYVGVATHGALAYRHGKIAARFGPKNVNSFPTVFAITGVVKNAHCKAAWYRVELPLRPNGATGLVRAHALEVQTVRTRIVVDVSARKLTLFRSGKRILTATVAVGSPSTPTPTGRYYVNQRLVPTDPNGPYGPGAVGISAFSNVLTGWAQGGPIGIHGTNEPWSIGHPVSNGCIRLPNATLRKVFAAAVAGTPVIIRA